MKYAIISDLHANIDALQVVLAKIDASDVDQIVCLGDVVGYNAAPNECVAAIRERAIPTICGNHDAVACGLEEPWGFNPVALSAAMWTRESLAPDNLEWLKALPDVLEFEDFLAVHGSPNDRDRYLFNWEDVLPHLQFLQNHDHTLCFFGHTHCPGIFSADGMYGVDPDGRFRLAKGKRYFINPGSVGQPRDGNVQAAFGILDTKKGEYEQVRVSYPVKDAADKVINSGLPHFLAERLYLGR